MKKYYDLFDKITAFPNLLKAYKNARRGKRKTTALDEFTFNQEKELLLLKRELETGTYQHGKYTEFNIFEPKKRMISAAPFRDRVVHHAVCNIVMPLFEHSFIYDSYANRKGKGTHRAIRRYMFYARKFDYVLKMDIAGYFPAIDHTILKDIIRNNITCRKTYSLLEHIIDASNRQAESVSYFPEDDLFTPYLRRKGLPIGNLTSQWFANIYLSPLDHFVQNVIRVPAYIRYVDDFVVFSNKKADLQKIKRRIEIFLYCLRLDLNKNKSTVYKTAEGVNFLGHKVFSNFTLLGKKNKMRAKRRFSEMARMLDQGYISIEQCLASARSWEAHAAFSRTFRLRDSFSEVFPEIFIASRKKTVFA